MKKIFNETDYQNYLSWFTSGTNVDSIFDTLDLRYLTNTSFAFYCAKNNLNTSPELGMPNWPEEAFITFERMIKDYEWEQEETARLGMIESNEHDYERV